MKKEDKFSDEDEEEEGGEDKKTPFFNMANATLERVDKILQQIASVSSNNEIPPAVKQANKISSIKILLTYSIPLSPKEFTTEFRKKILELQPKYLVRKGVRGGCTTHQEGYVFDKKLELELDNAIIEISETLQKKGFFMPSKDESSMF